MNGWGIHGVEGMSRVSWDHLTFQHFQPPWDPPPGPSTIPSPWDPQVPQNFVHSGTLEHPRTFAHPRTLSHPRTLGQPGTLRYPRTYSNPRTFRFLRTLEHPRTLHHSIHHLPPHPTPPDTFFSPGTGGTRVFPPPQPKPEAPNPDRALEPSLFLGTNWGPGEGLVKPPLTLPGQGELRPPFFSPCVKVMGELLPSRWGGDETPQKFLGNPSPRPCWSPNFKKSPNMEEGSRERKGDPTESHPEIPRATLPHAVAARCWGRAEGTMSC